MELTKEMKDLSDLSMMIGASIFRAKEEEIKEEIKAIISELEGEISIEEVREMMNTVSGSMAERIIEERERL